MRDEVIIEALELIEGDRGTFNSPDPLLAQIIEVESSRLRRLAPEWDGMFSHGHVLLIARAYYNLEKVKKFKKIP